MSRTIDERVVEMRFDNKQFESGAKQTMGTLDKLKNSLKIQDYSSSFENLQKTINRIDFIGISNALENAKRSFSTFEILALSVLSNIVNKAVSAGAQIVKSLSIDQVMAGFGEYELKMGSIQTIMASTGESLDTVNKYLEELNAYSDKTIYSFSDMTQNIGKFTNAGVKLEDAVKAIQGVSNAAAVAGRSSNEASHAMYNFAQALSSGSVKLTDWKSIQTANMDTVEFKQQLLDTALAMGTVVKEGDKYQTTTTNMLGKVSGLFDATSAFNESLAHQWITTDVLVQTLSNYSNDVRTMTEAEKEAYEEKLRGIGYTEDQIKAIEELGIKAFNSAQDVKTFNQLMDTMKESLGSGWAQTFELIFGNFEEAKQLWTNVNNTLGAIIKESSDSRNELLKGWKEAGGRDALFGAISNSFNSLLSIVKAINKAFRNIFPKATGKQLADITKGFRDLTARLTPSANALKNLEKMFTGLFSITDIMGQAVGAFFKLISPAGSVLKDFSGGVLGVAASFGDWATNLNKVIKDNGLFLKAVDKIRENIGYAADNVEVFIGKAVEMFKSLFGFEKLNVDGTLNNVSNAFRNLSFDMTQLNFKNAEESFETLKTKIQELVNLLKSNEGLSTFVANAKKFGEDLREVFTLDNLLDRIERIMDVFGKFFNWIKTTMAPAFKDFNVGGAVAAGGGLGIIYALIKTSKAFENVTKSIKAIPDLLGGIKDTLVAYQNDLKANTILKIAGAITLLAGALVLLSFTDTNRLMEAAKALSLIAGVLLGGISLLLYVTKDKGKDVNDALTTFASGFSKAMEQVGKSLKIRAIGTTVKKFAESIAIIAVSIIALGIMYKKDKDSLMAGTKMVGDIGIALVAIMLVGSLLGKFAGGGMRNFSSLLKSVSSLAIGLFIVVAALNKLFKMELPADYKTKLVILGGIFLGLAALAVIVGIAGMIAGGGSASLIGGMKGPLGSILSGVSTTANGGAITAAPILALTAMLYATVSAVSKLFKMNIPSDWQKRMTILGLVFVAIAGLMVTMGIASRLAGGTIKAAGTILSMCLFIGVIVAALMVLTIIPFAKLITGAISLGIILTALGAALYGAGKITEKDTYKSVLAMAIVVGTITASLAVLAMVPWPTLLKGGVALGGVLLALANTFNQVSKITNSKAWTVVAAMVAAVVAISASLYFLADKPWQNLIAAAVALGGVLFALSKCFEAISTSSPNLATLGTFLSAVVALGVIAYAIYELAKHPWENLLAAAGSLSMVLMSITATMAICTGVGSFASAALTGLGILDAFIANFALIIAAFGLLAKSEDIRSLISGGIEMLVQVGQGIGDFVGAIINGVLTGISNALPAVGEGLSGFMDALGGFVSGAKNIDEEVLAGVGILAACIIAITAAEVIAGIGAFLGGAAGLVSVAANLVLFIETLGPFLSAVKGLDAEAMEAVKNLAEMIIILTAADLISGLGKVFGLTGNLSEFGFELVKFGPSIALFAAQVKNVNPEAVQGAAAAAEIMANLATKLPATGGLVQKIFGSKSLSEFGDELNKFGPRIVTFSTQVKNVVPEAVQGAAAAAEIMANIATKLPIANGLVQKIFGSKSLAEFGDELVKFGPRIKLFSIQVSGIEPSAVSGVQTVTTIMSNLANNLPNSETLWQKIFGGGKTTLSEFGTELASFGSSMSAFAQSVSGIDILQISGVITSFKSLVDLATSIQGTSATDLINFANQLGEISTESVNKFIQPFNDAGPKAVTAINSLCTVINQALTQGLVNGITTQTPLILSMVLNLCTAIINRFRTSLTMNTFKVFGQNMVTWIIQGMNDRKPAAISSAVQICNAIVQAFRNNLTQAKFVEIGANAALGLKYGIESKINEIAAAAIRAAREAVEAAKEELDEESPSKVMFGVGEFFSLGLAKGIVAQLRAISLAGTKASDEAIKPVEGAINTIGSIIDSSNFNVDPVIRPVVDLSEVQKGVKDISSLMGQTYDLSSVYNKAMDVSSSFNKNKVSKINENVVNSKSGEGDKYEFNQYNYSPKALTRSEIYRQTNNQFSAFRRAVNPS